MQRQQVSAQDHSVDYLVDLLTRYVDTTALFAKDTEGKLQDNVLAEMYAKFLQANPSLKGVILRRMGDTCLFVTGFFSDSLNRKLVDVDYYFGMGGIAYQTLSNSHNSNINKAIFGELSEKFKKFAEVFSELSDKGNIHNNKDLLRIYEKWLHTGSDHLRNLLSEHGIKAPIQVDIKPKH